MKTIGGEEFSDERIFSWYRNKSQSEIMLENEERSELVEED